MPFGRHFGTALLNSNGPIRSDEGILTTFVRRVPAKRDGVGIMCVQARSPLEPLLFRLAREFSDDQDLSDRLQRLYQVKWANSGRCYLSMAMLPTAWLYKILKSKELLGRSLHDGRENMAERGTRALSLILA